MYIGKCIESGGCDDTTVNSTLKSTILFTKLGMHVGNAYANITSAVYMGKNAYEACYKGYTGNALCILEDV